MMLHKISDFCKKIDSIKAMSDRLMDVKYNQPKSPQRDITVKELIDVIQSDCYIVSQDKQDYSKEKDA